MNQPNNGLKTVRRTLAVTAAALAGPAILCAAVWYGQLRIPPPETSGPVVETKPDDRPEAADGRRDLILVDERLPDGLPQTLRDAARQTVPLKAVFSGGQTCFGTGFIFAPGTVVTAAHILEAHGSENLTQTLVYCGGQNVTAGVVVLDPIRDVAILSADCGGERLGLDARQPRTGDQFYVSGFSFGDLTAVRFLTPTRSRARAKVTYRSPDSLDPRFQKMITEAAKQKTPRLRAIDAELVRGNSGSPVFRANGRITGMVVMVDQLQHLTFYVPAVNIRHALRRAGVE